MKKRVFYTEAAYLIGEAAIALATAMMASAGFGVSMVVAPAYLVHLKLSQTLPWFTFGCAELALQVVLVAATMLFLGRFRLSLLFSFATAFLYSAMLDGFSALIALLPALGLAGRLLVYGGGIVICSFGVSCMFHTYISPAAYEMFVKEVSGRFGRDLNRFKLGYDLASCAAAIAMSFAFFGFGKFEGVKVGTVLCAFVNGPLIALFSRLLESRFEFRDRLKLRSRFE